jgi:predicted RNA-binding Zn-ribbon protein involved in translation (DUF1610 family)
MDGEYSYEWAELRKIQRRLLKALWGGIAVVFLVPLANRLPSMGFAVFGVWVIIVCILFVGTVEYSLWSCPRCGKPFHSRIHRFGRWSNPFARRCINCGLPKWEQSDPDPILKQELSPFRIDLTFKLADLEPVRTFKK